ncbi:MAG TPA: sugar ABC transporter permease, partial [Clostridiales bacterium]|nr:sugar ABC transporter permease [Clostridiales bacterium]
MNAVKGSSGFRLSKGDRTYYTIVNVIMLLLLVIVAYPLVYIISASFSSP